MDHSNLNEDQDLQGEPDPAEIKRLMAPIPNDDREIWFTLAGVCHELFEGSEEGFLIWSEWSESSNKYDPDDQRRVWDSLGRYGGKRVGFGTLHHLAKKYGDPEKVEAKLVAATPYVCRDPSSMSLRPWVYGRQLLRGSLSLVVAPGATGKTALVVGTCAPSMGLNVTMMVVKFRWTKH
jgi:hypothetical protein